MLRPPASASATANLAAAAGLRSMVITSADSGPIEIAGCASRRPARLSPSWRARSSESKRIGMLLKFSIRSSADQLPSARTLSCWSRAEGSDTRRTGPLVQAVRSKPPTRSATNTRPSPHVDFMPSSVTIGERGYTGVGRPGDGRTRLLRTLAPRVGASVRVPDDDLAGCAWVDRPAQWVGQRDPSDAGPRAPAGTSRREQRDGSGVRWQLPGSPDRHFSPEKV